MLRVHRVAYELRVGPIPEGMQIDHLCRVRRCVNPAHLEPVSQTENIRRGDSFAGREARQTHCIYGHPFSFENTLLTKSERRCRACQRRRNKLRKARLRNSTAQPVAAGSREET